MNELRIESLTMPAVKLGPENPLAPLDGGKTDLGIGLPPDLQAEVLENIAYGRISSVLPYSLQDGFNRHLEETPFKVAVLENDFLRATFLLEFGGRLWSLVHKPSGRELLEVNPVFQLANLAVRKAWFSGGVEWNIGTIGHSPFTCSPLFACRVEGYERTPILRLYEWERIRGVPFQIDAYLPESSPFLFIQVRIQNPNEWDVPMYWWSNISVPETTGTRLLVPAESAFCLGCEAGQLTRVPVPEYNGVDYSYSTNVSQAADIFFDLPDSQFPWIAALDGGGAGIVQLSTSQLKGRKLWVWGQGTGGRNWQKFLSPRGQGYVEIQAGLTRTQLEHQRMPAGESWSWLEAYGHLETDPDIVHGSDWGYAWQHVDQYIRDQISAQELAITYQRGAEFANAEPVEFYQLGSGWGALECLLKKRNADQFQLSPGLIFGDDSITNAQLPWISLLEKGIFPDGDPNAPPAGFEVSARWADLLEKALSNESSNNWMAWYHAGLMRYHAGDQAGAREAWENSLAQVYTPWAARNLAFLSWNEGDVDHAADLLLEAHHAAPGLVPLAVECGRCLLECGRPKDWLGILEKLREPQRTNGRIRLLEAQASLITGNLDLVDKFFKEGVVVADLREGEASLTELWFAYHAMQLSIAENIPFDDDLISRVEGQVTVPISIDFRMKSGIGV